MRGVERAEAEVAGREVELLVVERIVGDVHLAVDALHRPVGVDDHRGVVIDAGGAPLEQRADDDDLVLGGDLGQRRRRRARDRLGEIEVRVILRLAEVLGRVQLGQADHLRAARCRLANLRERALAVLRRIVGAAHLDETEREGLIRRHGSAYYSRRGQNCKRRCRRSTVESARPCESCEDVAKQPIAGARRLGHEALGVGEDPLAAAGTVGAERRSRRRRAPTPRWSWRRARSETAGRRGGRESGTPGSDRSASPPGEPRRPADRTCRRASAAGSPRRAARATTARARRRRSAPAPSRPRGAPPRRPRAGGARQELRSEANAQHRAVARDRALQQRQLGREVRKARVASIGDAHRPAHHDQDLVGGEIRGHRIAAVNVAHVQRQPLFDRELAGAFRPFGRRVLQNDRALFIALLLERRF